jgi:hypothetical protein
MNEQVQQLEEVAGRCLQLALVSRSPSARRAMRLLAADLILAAEERRRANAGNLDEEFAELIRLTRRAG